MKRFLFLNFTLLLAIRCHAQLDSLDTPGREPNWKDKMVFGGNIGLSFGNITTIGVAPLVGYRLTDRLVAGVGGSIYYTSYHFPGYTVERTYVYGGNLWSRFYVLPKIFLVGEAEGLNSEWDPYGRPGYRSYRNTYMAGAGYREYYGKFSNYFVLMYVLNYNESAYASPLVIQAGFAWGM